MASSALLAAAVVFALSPADASHLAPGPQPSTPVRISSSPSPSPDAPSPILPAGVAVAVAGAAVVGAAGRKRVLDIEVATPGSALGLRPPDDALVVFVPGHGSSTSADTFADLIDLMGVGSDQVRHFDYRWTGDGVDHARAASAAGVEDTANALAAYLTGLASAGRPMHLVGYSKGGVAVAELIEWWDRGRSPVVEGVVGATLLDPPMATGVHGLLQSIGGWFGLPHDGGYDPVECSAVFWGCTDHRVGLGRSAGVDVAVVRSPDAAVTNFADHPDGLAVFEAPDAGPSVWEALRSGPVAAVRAAEAAHRAVLSDPGVAACIVGQMHGGACGLPVAGVPPTGSIVHGVGGNLAVRTV